MDYITKLGHILSSSPTTIELIPGNGQEWLESFPQNAHAPFLFVEGNLGVPEKILYKTYLAAIKLLGEPRLYRQTLQSIPAEDRFGLGDRQAKDALALTSILLLANPAHQTALNIRKTIIFSSRSATERKRACTAELDFTASLLSVKQCAKVSMLWNHRRALLSSMYTQIYPDPCEVHGKPIQKPPGPADEDFVKVELPIAALQVEYDLAARACEVYPRNYYAWHHRSLCLQSCLASYTRRSRSRSSNISTSIHVSSDTVDSHLTDLTTVLTTELAHTKRWIERHISDHSAVDYACRVVQALGTLPRPHPSLHSTPQSDPKSDSELQSKSDAESESESLQVRYTTECIRHALDLVQAYPSHEALWLYVRRTLLMLVSRDSDSESESESAVAVAKEADAIARRVVTEASQRCQANTHTDSGSSSASASAFINHELHTIIRHALRFLLWKSQILRMTDSSDTGYDFFTSACIHFSAAASAKSSAALLRTISSIE